MDKARQFDMAHMIGMSIAASLLHAMMGDRQKGSMGYLFISGNGNNGVRSVIALLLSKFACLALIYDILVTFYMPLNMLKLLMR